MYICGLYIQVELKDTSYKLWYSNKTSSKSFIGRDVTFREDEMYMSKVINQPNPYVTRQEDQL